MGLRPIGSDENSSGHFWVVPVLALEGAAGDERGGNKVVLLPSSFYDCCANTGVPSHNVNTANAYSKCCFCGLGYCFRGELISCGKQSIC